MHNRSILVPLTAAAVLAGGCAPRTAPRTAPGTASPAASSVQAASLRAVGLTLATDPDTVVDFPGFNVRIHREGRVTIAGQPTEDAVRELPRRGVTAVVNLRTPKEMSDTTQVAFDEARLVRELGLAYVQVPLGGADHPYTPAAVDSFAAVLDRYRGPVLLHCTVGGRASNLWAAYLVRRHGFDLAEAYARGQAMGIGQSPFGQLLGRKLQVIYAD